MGKPVVHLVDDDDGVRGTLARLLLSGGYDVLEYASGTALLAAAETIDGGCILLDINMPDPDGFAVHRSLCDQSIDAPVIMMTGSGDLTVLALKSGAAEFLQKPFGRGELLTVLDELFAAKAVPSRPALRAALAR